MKVDVCRRRGLGKVSKFHRLTVNLPFKQTSMETQILTKKTKDKRKPTVVISLMCQRHFKQSKISADA